MDIKIIKTEDDYELALQEIDRLMDAEPGSPEENRLEVLALLVEIYEEEHFPIDLPDPISAIKFRMEQAGLKQKDLIPYIGSQSRVSEVLNGKRELSKEMIRKLHEGLGIPLEVLLNTAGSDKTEPEFSLSDYPFFNQMVKRGYFKGIKSLREAKPVAKTLIDNLFSHISQESSVLVYTRKSDRPVDTLALKAWQARALQLLETQEIVPFDANYPQQYLINQLLAISNHLNPVKIKQALNDAGIHFLILEHLDRTYLDGASFMTKTGNPVIAMTLRYDREDNFWFTLFHELGHIFLHLTKDSNQAFFDDTYANEPGKVDQLEREANEFAQNAMISQKQWQDFKAREKAPDESKIMSFAKKLGISPAIPAGRMRYENQDYRGWSKLVTAHSVRESFVDYDAGFHAENDEVNDEVNDEQD